jgi:NCAIR mutase (PurE)-related protein
LNQDNLRDLLVRLSKGEISVEESLETLKRLPFEDLGFACVDHHRGLRRGLSEVIFGERKDVPDILAIMESMLRQGDNVLVTRLSTDKALRAFKDADADQAFSGDIRERNRSRDERRHFRHSGG